MSIRDSIQYLKALRSLEASKGLMHKSAAQPPMGPPPGDPSMGGGMPPGGAPPMDPSMMGGAPPMDPSMMGGAPPMDPSMMGGAPPMDPSMMGGMPPMDPSMMGGMPPAAPAAGGAPATPQEAEQKVTNKVKTEQWMQHIDSYNYNLLKLMINLYEHLGIPVPAESLLPQPLGSNSPSAGDISGMMGAAADATSPQTPVDAMASGDAAPPSGPGTTSGGDAAGGAPPEGMPPMEGGDVKQSSWDGWYRGYMQSQKPVNTSWKAPHKKQAGYNPTSLGATKPVKKQVFNYPNSYADVMYKFNKLRGFN